VRKAPATAIAMLLEDKRAAEEKEAEKRGGRQQRGSRAERVDWR